MLLDKLHQRLFDTLPPYSQAALPGLCEENGIPLDEAVRYIVKARDIYRKQKETPYAACKQ